MKLVYTLHTEAVVGDKKSISLSSGEINAIYFLCKYLEYND